MTNEPVSIRSTTAPPSSALEANGAANEQSTVVHVDKTLQPLVPRMTRLVEGYVDFLRWTLRERSLDTLSSCVRDLRAIAQLFGMMGVVDLCVRLEWAARARMDEEAFRCIDQLAALVHDATFVYC